MYRDLDKEIILPLWQCLWDERVKHNQAKRTIVVMLENPNFNWGLVSPSSNISLMKELKVGLFRTI